MTPFVDFLYFGVLLYPLIPAVALGLLGRLGGRFALVATAFMLCVQYWPGDAAWLQPLSLLAAFGALQLTVAWGLARARARGPLRWAFYLALALALAPLLVSRYASSHSAAWDPGFVGLSYVTFRSLDVLFNIQDGVVASVSPAVFLGYLFFFPSVSAGPIDRYRRFLEDWAPRGRADYLMELDAGVDRIFRGLLYKFILAALIQTHWLAPLEQQSGIAATVAYMYAYSLYLFFDFAGYSALAVGVSRCLGVRTPENFDQPFRSLNIREFWNRWHISLSFWFRDHVFTRFLLAATRGRWFKERTTASHLGLLLTMGLMGLWHGTALRYLVYGLYHGVLLVVHDVFTRRRKARGGASPGVLARAAALALTFNAVCFGFLIFSGRLF